ncbi:hypothetical protein Tco_0393368 [Tanacetum coccineum]
METEEVSERYITPCFIDGLNAYDGEMNLEYEKNMISNEFAVKLCLEYEVKNNEKVVKRELLVALRGELYFFKFIINPDEDDVDPGVIFGRSFLRLTKEIVIFRNGILTIYPDLITFNDDSDDELDAILASIDVSDLPPLDITDIPPFIALLDKLKLDGEVEVEEVAMEELIRSYKAIKEKMKIGKRTVKPVSHIITMLDHSKARPMGILKDVLCQVGVTTILAKNLLLDIPVDRDVTIVVGRSFLYTCGAIMNIIKGTTSTFNGIVHQKFYVPNVRNAHEESDSDDEEEYCLKRDEIGKPIYGPNHAKYLSCDDPMDRALALQKALNSFKKIYVWKKAIAFLDSLPVPLQHAEWMPNRSGNFAKENGDEKWHAKIRVVDPYGNIFEQGYETKATDRKLSKYYKLIDIMSPNWF